MAWFVAAQITHLIFIVVGVGMAISACIFFALARRQNPNARHITYEIPGVGKLTTSPAQRFVGLAIACLAGAATIFIEAREASDLQAQAAKLRSSTVPMTGVASRLYDEFWAVYRVDAIPMKPKQFERMQPLIALLNTYDSLNGHALYFQAEVKHATQQCNLLRPLLWRYVELADSRESEMGTDTGPEVCYALPHGFCRQRTGFAEHLLALGFYADGRRTVSPGQRSDLFAIALKHVRESIRWYPRGFSQVISSDGLTRTMNAQLRAANKKGRVPEVTPMKLRC